MSGRSQNQIEEDSLSWRAEAIPHAGSDRRVRRYRSIMGSRFRSFPVLYKETDLWVGIEAQAEVPGIEGFLLARTKELRANLEAYGAQHPEFLASLIPLPDDPQAPAIARSMLAAAQRAGVGPMAAVAGAMAQDLAEAAALAYGLEEIIIENGGDIWMRFTDPLDIAVFAGDSPLSGRVGVRLPPEISPCSVCTSSGTVGPSLSFGRADAAMVVSRSGALADAWATALGNMVGTPQDIEAALERACADPGLEGCLVVAKDRIGIRGRLPLRIFAPGTASA